MRFQLWILTLLFHVGCLNITDVSIPVADAGLIVFAEYPGAQRPLFASM